MHSAKANASHRFLSVLLFAFGVISVLLALPHSAETASTITKPPNNLGLVGYWSFNEGTGTIATDFSGNGNTGPLGGGAAWATGKRGKAISLTSENDRVATADINSTDGASALTLSLWLRDDNPTAAWRIISKNTSGTPGWEFRMGVSNTMVFTVAGTDDHVASGHTGNVWEYWTIVFDGTQSGDDNRLRIYKNGVYLGAIPHFASVPATTGSNANVIYIGDNPDLSGPSWRGLIDDVRIYNRALGATEVAKLYASGAVKFTTSSVELQKGSTLGSGLVGHWTLDGPDVTTTVTDRSGNNNSGYFYGGATSSAKVIRKLGQAFSFDAVDDYVNLPTFSQTLLPATITAWVKVDSLNHSYSNDQVGVVFARGPASGIHIVESARVLGYHWNDDIATYNWNGGPPIPSDGTWFLAALVVESTQAIAYVYSLEGLNSAVRAVPHSSTVINGTLNIGRDTFGNRFFDGQIDDVGIYNRALSVEEIKQLYRLGQVTVRQ